MKAGLNVALYMRLSKDDGGEESQSIVSQRQILVDYALKNGWKRICEYVDDGYSGTSFDRPQFKRLVEDIELGAVDIVITKDLSRLGRNYVQVGYYTEEYFPSKGIRYIALNDGYDSEKENSDELVPFKNVINEWYARDISKKIRSVLDSKAKNGQSRNTVFPIFGYKYNELYEREPDPETAPIVRLIYSKFIELGSTGKVAKYLQEQGVKNPSYYNAVKYGYNKYSVLTEGKNHCVWLRSTVCEIIKKEEYLGDYFTAKTKTVSFKNKKRLNNSSPYVFRGKYPPIVDRQSWLTANGILRRSRGVGDKTKNLLNGLLLCADCGKPLRYESRSGGKTRYYCSFKDCSCGNSIYGEGVDALLDIALSLNLEILRENKILIANEVVLSLTSRISDGRAEIERRKDNLISLSESLFNQYSQGIVPESIYQSILKKIDLQIEQAREDERRLLTKVRKRDFLECDVYEVVDGITSKSEPLRSNVRRLIKAIKIKRLSRKKEYDVRVIFFNESRNG